MELREAYIDSVTGTFVSTEAIVDEYFKRIETKQRYTWVKLYPQMLKNLGFDVEADSPRAVVLLWILNNLNFGDNTFPGRKQYIADEAKIGLSTVQRTINMLCTNDYVRPTPDGRLMINPNVLHAGDDGRQIWLNEKYNLLKFKPRSKRPQERKERSEQDEGC